MLTTSPSCFLFSTIISMVDLSPKKSFLLIVFINLCCIVLLTGHSDFNFFFSLSRLTSHIFNSVIVFIFFKIFLYLGIVLDCS